MRRLLLVLLAAALLLGGGLSLARAWRAREVAAGSALERARLGREFAERAALARALPAEPPEAWRAEASALLGWYLSSIDAVARAHPGAPPRPGALARAEAERRGSLPAQERATLEEFQRYASGRVALLRSGRYAPLASAADAGLRLDLLAIEPGPSPAGGPGLRIDFALWGPPRLLERIDGAPRAGPRTTSPVSLDRLAVRLRDERGALYGEMTGAGEPYLKLLDGERFAEELPPSVTFGTWWLELLPREARTVELELHATIHGASGRAWPARLVASLPVEEGWTLPPGVAYQAEVREAAPPPPPPPRSP